MKKSLFSFLLGSICSIFSSKGECSNVLSRKMIENLHRTAHKPANRKVEHIDQQKGMVYVRDEPLTQEDVDNLKKKSFVPPKRTLKKADSETDIIYFEKNN